MSNFIYIPSSTEYITSTQLSGYLQNYISENGGTLTGNLQCTGTVNLGSTGAHFNTLYVNDVVGWGGGGGGSTGPTGPAGNPTGTDNSLAYFNSSGNLASNTNITVSSSGRLVYNQGMCQFLASNTQQALNNGSNTILNFPTTVFTSGSWSSDWTVSNNNQFQNTSGRTLYILVSYSVRFTNCDSYTQTWIWVNASGAYYGESAFTPSSSVGLGFNGTAIIQVANNSYIEMMGDTNNASVVFSNSGNGYDLGTLTIMELPY